MLIYLFKGDGEIQDINGGNINTISLSVEIQPELRTWYGGKAHLGDLVQVTLGEELPATPYQFVIRKSSVRIPAINYTFVGGKGFLYANKLAGQPLFFEQWDISKISSPTIGISGVYSPIKFEYRDSTPWDCYSSAIPDTPEYGYLAPVIDISSSQVDFIGKVPAEYAVGAKISLKIALQTISELV